MINKGLGNRTSHYLIRSIARHSLPQWIRAYINKRLRKWRTKKEFTKRIHQINPSKYIDISYRPDLNVILLVIDSLRNSRLSCQGYFRETTPFLDTLQPRFTAISASPWTYPSVASILTGLYPHNHNAVVGGKVKDIGGYNNYLKLRRDILTLPEILFSLGHRIYFGTAIPAAYWSIRARAAPTIFDPSTKASRLFNYITKWISKNRERRFFAYAHLADLHIPLNPPPSFRNYFGDVKNLPNIDTYDFDTSERRKSYPDLFREYRFNRELLYDNLLRYVDYEIEQFYNSIKEMGLTDSTIFIVTADHGDQFWEHVDLEEKNFFSQRDKCGFGHGRMVFNQVIQVPLLISGPVLKIKPVHLVSTVDIAPTVMDLLGITHNIGFDGNNVFKAQYERPLISEACACGYEKKALITGKYKLIYSEDDDIEWLFDLENDPQEQHPITDKQLTGVFVNKLKAMLRDTEKRKISEIVQRKQV